MKVIVEWGRPQLACQHNRPCGVSGRFIATNAKQAAALANQLVHTLSEGLSSTSLDPTAWKVNAGAPRKTWWAKDQSAWVTVSVLDGVARGDYAALADKQAVRLQEQARTEMDNLVSIKEDK